MQAPDRTLARQIAPGTVVNGLEVIRFVGVDPQHNGQHECRCRCGRIFVCKTYVLKKNKKPRCNHPDCAVGKVSVSLVGIRFGSLVVVSEEKLRDGKWGWMCRCDCGGSKVVRNGHLRSGHTTSCGCVAVRRRLLQGEVIRKLKVLRPDVGKRNGSPVAEFICECGHKFRRPVYLVTSGAKPTCGRTMCKDGSLDITGKRFGRLLVHGLHEDSKRQTTDDPRRHVFWDVECDCGRRLKVQRDVLVSGKRSTCGRGTCKWNWRGGKRNKGSEAWARNKLACIGKASRYHGWAEPYQGWEDVLLLWKESDGTCQCCKTKSDKLCLDHCHATGRLRGFICNSCNTAIGLFGEKSHRLVMASKYVASQCQQLRIPLFRGYERRKKTP